MEQVDKFLDLAHKHLTDRGGRLTQQEFARVYGMKVIERLLNSGRAIKHEVIRRDISNRIAPQKVTYIQLKGYQPPTPPAA